MAANYNQYNSYQGEGDTTNGPPPAYNPEVTQGAPQPDTMKAPLTSNAPFSESNLENKGDAKCQDCIWVPIFLAQLFAIIGLSIYYYTKNGSDFLDEDSSDNSFVDKNFWSLCACVVLMGIFSAAIWILFIRRFSYCLIWFSLILTLSMWIAFGIISVALGQVGGLIIALIFVAIQALWMWCVKDRIAFASAVLEMAVTAANEFAGTYLVSFLSIFVQAFWMLVWIMGFCFVIYDGTKSSDSDDSSNDTNNSNNTTDDSGSSSSNSVNGFLVFLFLVSFYWTAQVIANIVHVTCAGAVATWYFLFPQNTPKRPVGGAMKRAMTTSFGSICFGSFLIAVIQALRAMIRSAERNNNGFVRCCIQCILACLQNILEYFNLYAFTRVAMYGQSYCQAARETWELFKSKGFDAIINDDLTQSALNISCVFAGLLSACVSGLIAYLMNNEYWYVWAIVAFLIAFGLCLCAMVVVRSGVATIFVCFAEDPSILSETKPEHYEKITNAWRSRYGELPARLTNPPRV